MQNRFNSAAGAIPFNHFLLSRSWFTGVFCYLSFDGRETEKIRIFRRKVFWVVLVFLIEVVDFRSADGIRRIAQLPSVVNSDRRQESEIHENTPYK